MKALALLFFIILTHNTCLFIKDFKGEYGLTQWGYAIVDEPEYLNIYEDIFKTELFQKIKEAIHLDSSSYNIKILKQFDKRFYEKIFKLINDNYLIESS